jgi:hypothetical protein
MWDGSEVKWDESFSNYTIVPFTSYYPIIADELKPYFRLVKLDTLITHKKNKKVIIYKNYGENLSKYLKNTEEELSDNLIDEIRKCYVFRSVLGLTNNTLGKMVILGNNITSFKEDTPTLLKSKSNISPSVFKKWFNNDYEILRDYYDFDIDNILENVRNIIVRLDQEYISWLNIIKSNLYQFSHF